jgi:GT2 family glycosyltransferase
LSANVFDYYTGKRYDPWHWFTEEEHHMDKLLPITFVNGNGSAYRKSVLEEVAYFSKSLFFYGWEMDICAKIIDAGYDVMYYPKVEILHKISKVSRNQGRSLYLMTTNGFWYYIRFFPIGIILREIPKNLVYYGAMAIRKKCFLSYLHALGSVVVGLPDVLRDRKPVKKENVARILGQYDVWKLTKLKAKEALK